MKQYLVSFLLLGLLFGSVDAAIDTVHIDIDHNQSPGHLIHDHDESSSNVGDQKDSCNHYCHCAAQLGMFFSYTTHMYPSCSISKITDFYRYHSPPLTPLFRPPIS